MNTIATPAQIATARERNSQQWASPAEMHTPAHAYPHGLIDVCDDGTTPFRRVWDAERGGIWLLLPGA